MSSKLAPILVEWQDDQVRKANQVKLLIDDKSTINLVKNSIANEKSKHIETIFHFLRDQVKGG